jgi:hypothetical protein
VTRGTRPKKPTSSRGFASEAPGARGSWESWGLKTEIFFSLFKTAATTKNKNKNKFYFILFYFSSGRICVHRVGASRDVIKDDFGGKLPFGRPFRPDVRGRRPDVRGRPRLPRGRVFTIRGRGKNRVCADARVCPCGRTCVRPDTSASARKRNKFKK